MIELPTPETDAAEAKRRAEWLHKHKAHKDWILLSVSEVTVIRDELLILERERDEALMALKCIDEAILVMKPRHIGQPDMDGRYPCWSVWLPKSGRVERKSLQDALLEFAAQIKEETK